MDDPKQRSAREDRSDGAIPFVGRTRELAILRQALEDVRSGQRRIVLLSGEPGIGKTRLSEAFALEAADRGLHVAWGSCNEWEGAPPFWPWIQVIRSIAREQDMSAVERELGPRFVNLVQLLPETGASPTIPIDPLSLSGGAGRFRLFDSAAALLTLVASETPLVVILDDLHWADTPTLLLLQFVAQHTRDVPLMLLGTYRSEEISPKHPLTEVVGGLARIPGVERISLQGLALDETGVLIESIVGRPLPERTLDAVRHRVEGNPLFASEVSSFLLAQADLATSSIYGSVHFQVPEGVRDVLERRLRRLSNDCQELLASASVIGREFSTRLLTLVSERSLDGVLTLLDEAVQARLLDLAATVGSYRFHHALVQDVLYASLAPSRRMQLHRRVGESLEDLHAHNLELLLDELAHHFFHALPIGDPDRALDYVTRGAERSLAQFAWESAVDNYERALQAFDLTANQDLGSKCGLLLALGDAQMLGERSNWGSPVARDTFLRAADLARNVGTPEQLARAALGFAGRNVMATPSGEEQVALLEEALARLGTVDSKLRARVLARLAIDRNVTDLPRDPLARVDRSSRIHKLSDEAISVARRVDDPETLAFTLLAKRVACATHDNLDERIALSGEAATLTDASGNIDLGWFTSLLFFWDCSELGDLAAEMRAFERHVEHERQVPTPFKEWGLHGHRALFALREGDYAAAEHFAQQSLGDLPVVLSPWLHFHLRREQDRLREIETDIEQIAWPQDVWRTRGAIQILLAVELGQDDADERFDKMAAVDFSDIPCTERRLDVLILLTESCLILKDERRAQSLYDLLLPYRDRVASILMVFTYYGAVARFLGMLAAELSRWDEAEIHFTTALEINERLRLRPFAAHTCHEWAKMLLKRGDPADLTRARDLNDQALDAAREIGMTRLQRMAASLSACLVSTEPRAPLATVVTSIGLSLTPREAEVLRLVSTGKSNREIADELFLSTRTVERHVENLYRKLDVHTRAEAIAYALRQSPA